MQKGHPLYLLVGKRLRSDKGHLLLHLFVETQEDGVANVLHIWGRELSPFCACFLVGGLVSESLLVSGLVNIEGLPMDFLFLWRLSILSSKDPLCSVQC